MVSPNHSSTGDPSHGPHNSPVLCFVLVIPQWIRATSTSVTATCPLPCHLQPAGPNPGVQRSPSALLWGGAPCQLWQTDSRICQDWGSTERGKALRPCTHFIPSHLYWISQISGLRELVYPIKLHCKGCLCPASLPEALGCSVGRAGGPDWGRTARGTGSPRYGNSLPQTLIVPGGCWHIWGSQVGTQVTLSCPPTRCKHLVLLALTRGKHSPQQH